MRIITFQIAVSIALATVTTLVMAASTFSPSGDVAKYRYTGYFEAMTVLYASSLPEEEKMRALDVLLMAPEIEKYIVEISSTEVTP